ncbi:MAG: PAS domain S-box protein [Ilumatobacter sp.]|nr:PAS domain S-box protein [Ilumatobacter sp.]
MIADGLAATLLNSSPDGLMLVTADGTIEVANRSASAVFGYSSAELVGMNVDQLVPDEKRHVHARHRERFQQAPDERPMGTGLQLFAQHADGSMFPVEISLSPVTVDDEVHTIATVRDVSERQEARASLALLKDRERIARDLHDMVIQRLFAAGMGLQAIAGLVEPPNVAERITHVVDELDETIRELRSAIFELGQADQGRTLSSHVAALVEERSRNLAFTPALAIVGDLDDLGELIGEQLIATLAEALSNVSRHASATSATVRITRTVDSVCLEVTDDGVGIGGSPKRRGGISNMMWRAAELGGTCTVEPGTPTGTSLQWHVPV